MSRRRGHYASRVRKRLHAYHERLRQEKEHPGCRQCCAPLVTEQDQEIGYCYDCWAKLCNMDSDGILAFVSRRYENDNE